MARTSKVCWPSARAAVVNGVVQAAKAALSMRHWNVEFASVEVKVKVGVLSLVVLPSAGPPVMVVSGGVMSEVLPVMQPPSGAVKMRRLSRNAAESNTPSPWSKTDRYSEWAPAVTGREARSSGVEPSYVVPAASASLKPAVLMLMTLPPLSKAKLWGATTALLSAASAVKSDVSSSATNPSLTLPPTYSGNSSDMNLKSNARQLAPAGTIRSTLRVTRSKKVSPWLPPPPPAENPEPLLVLGSSAKQRVPVAEERERRPGSRESGQRSRHGGRGVADLAGEALGALVDVAGVVAAGVGRLAGGWAEVHEPVTVVVETVGASRRRVRVVVDLVVVGGVVTTGVGASRRRVR